MNKNQWIKECIQNYISNGVVERDANKIAQADALNEEIEHGSVALLWEPADSLVNRKMQQWSLGV